MTKKNDRANGNASAGEIDLPDIAPPDPVLAAVEQEIAEAEKKCARLGDVEHELAALREKIKSMEAERAKHTATLETAIEERRKFAFAASDGDPTAQEKLRAARTAQTEASLALEDSQSAVDEGRRRFEALEAEQTELLPNVAWHDALELAKDVLAEAAEIDHHLSGFAAAMAGHQEKLEAMRQMAQSAGRERAFGNCGVRQVMRVFDGKMVQIWPLEFEKPSPVYRENTYSTILKMQIANGIGHSTVAEIIKEDGAADGGAQESANQAGAGVLS